MRCCASAGWRTPYYPFFCGEEFFQHRLVFDRSSLTAGARAISEQVETRLMEWMLRGDIKPGTLIKALELALRFKIGIKGVREFLKRSRRFGLIEKRPNVGWLFKGFTEEFAAELFEISELFELRSDKAFVQGFTAKTQQPQGHRTDAGQQCAGA